MEWSDVTAAARAISWVAAFGTAGIDGRPHVSFVSPGFTDDGRLRIATRSASRKALNVSENSAVSLHWPVTGSGPGELFARGTASLHGDADELRRLWESADFVWEVDQFFAGGLDDPDLVMIDVAVTFARVLGPDGRHVWTPGAR